MSFRAILISVILVMSSSALAYPDGRKDRNDSQRLERTVPADPGVTVSICMTSGNVSVSGWDKNEVTARSDDAAQIELRRKDSISESGQAKRLEVVITDKGETPRARNTCQSSTDVTLKVPQGASVQVQTRDGSISIVSVASAYAGTQNGDISIERVSRSIETCTLGGTVSIKDSTGRVNVTSAGGSFEAHNIRPAENGDVFEVASVSGDITLDKVSHGQLSARTINGNMVLRGPLAHRGRYGFKTMSGDVTLTLPPDASFTLTANVSQGGEIITDFPLKLTSEPGAVRSPAPASAATSAASVKAPSPPQPNSSAAPAPSQTTANASSVTPDVVTTAKKVRVLKIDPVVVMPPYALRRINAICGTGDAIITVASFSGTLHLQKD